MKLRILMIEFLMNHLLKLLRQRIRKLWKIKTSGMNGNKLEKKMRKTKKI